MQRETSNPDFKSYGRTYQEPILKGKTKLIQQTIHALPRRFVTQFYQFNCAVHLQIKKGFGVLLVAKNPTSAEVQEFSLNRLVQIDPNHYFALVATTPELVVDLFTDSQYTLKMTDFSKPYEFKPVLPKIQIENILGYFYRVRSTDYFFRGERHDFFELTYVDSGQLFTEIEGKPYCLKDKDLILYGPNQFHTQRTHQNPTTSYITILFSLKNTTPVESEFWYEPILNRVFHYDAKISTLMKAFMRESATNLPYRNSLMLCLLTELILRLLQSTLAPISSGNASSHNSLKDELFDRIMNYIDENIGSPISISSICEQYSLSRSSLQILFKSMIDQSPKQYILDKKLALGCQMLKEGRYTVSEIALRLGYNSLYHFSNAFATKYHLSPSEYARQQNQKKV